MADNATRALKLVEEAIALSKDNQHVLANQLLFDAAQLLFEDIDKSESTRKCIENSENESFDDDYWNPYLFQLEDFKITFDDCIISDRIKHALIDTMSPMVNSEYFEGKVKPIKSVLLYGGNGVGKTILCKALGELAMRLMNVKFLVVNSELLTSKWYGEADKKVNALFRFAINNRPIIIFIDEVDSMFSRAPKDGGNMQGGGDDKIKNLFQIHLDGAKQLPLGVVLIACTNKPTELEIGFRSRFKKQIYIPFPTKLERLQIIKQMLKKIPCKMFLCDYAKLAELTEGYSGRDLENVITSAVSNMIRPGVMAKLDIKSKGVVQNKNKTPTWSWSWHCDDNIARLGYEDLVTAIHQNVPVMNEKEKIDLETYREERQDFESLHGLRVDAWGEIVHKLWTLLILLVNLFPWRPWESVLYHLSFPRGTRHYHYRNRDTGELETKRRSLLMRWLNPTWWDDNCSECSETESRH